MTEIPDQIAAVVLTRDGRGTLLCFEGDGLVKIDVKPAVLALVALRFAGKALRATAISNEIALPESAPKPDVWASVIDAART